MKTIFVTLLHRRSLFYEKSISNFLEAGYPLYLYITIDQNSFGDFGLTHPNITQIDAQIGSYDNAMCDLRGILDKFEWDTIVYLDSDIFFNDITYAEKLIKQFNESDYGFCSYFENVYEYTPQYKFDGLIAEVKDQKFEKMDQPPYTFKPNPHYENAFMLIKRTTWDKIPKEKFINMRELFKAIFETGAKMGVHKREAKLIFSHEGEGWFHVGNLTQYYYILDNGELNKLKPDSEIDKVRMGYFVAQRRRYGKEIYSDHVNNNLDQAIKMFSGEDSVYEAWDKLSELNF